MIEISGGDLDNPQEVEYGFTEIEYVQGFNGDSPMPEGVEPFKITDISCFETVGVADLDFNELSPVKIDHVIGTCSWWDIDVWDPSLLVFEKCTFSTPEGDIEVYTARYNDICEDEMVPEELESSVVWESTDDGWVEAE